jgi:predicted enzyme related to lactoylglutathione lyase
VHLDFVVPDIDAAVQRACAAGARLEGAVRTAEWGRIAVLSDPWGHGFCLIEFLGRGYDEIADASG